jgi:NADPH:quinone reductase-like Zn-dependent oxidoreductase
MKAIQMTSFGIDGLQLQEIPKPTVNSTQLLIRVKAASLNYLDLLVTKGVFNNQLPLPHIPITDVSGIVEQVGDKVTKFKVGDEVIPAFIRLWKKGIPTFEELSYSQRPSLGMQGYMAEYITVDQNELVHKPIGYSFEEAATLPIAGLSAWNGVKKLALQTGDSILIYGTGGVATFALLFAKAAGLKIFIAGRNDKNLAEMKKLGAHKIYNVSTQTNWKDEVLKDTKGKGINGIYETVGGENINHSLDLITIGGKITCVGLIQGFSMNINAGTLLWKQAQIIGIECGSTQDVQEMIEAIETNKIKPVIEKIFPLENTQEAFLHLERGGHLGKIIIQF